MFRPLFLFIVFLINISFGTDLFPHNRNISKTKSSLMGYPSPMQNFIYSREKHTIIYFDTSGQYAIDTTDLDFNNIPDFVDIIKDAIDSVWSYEIEKLGHREPIISAIWGRPFPIYLNEDHLTYGGTYFNQPGTINGAFTIFSSYIQINPKLNLFFEDDEVVNALEATLAHEFYHAIQLSYGVRYIEGIFPDLWLLESTATAFEEFVFDHANDYYQYLRRIQQFPWENGLISNSSYSYYGHSLFFIMLSEQTGNPFFMKQIWEMQDIYPGEKIISFLATLQNKNLNDILADYFLWRFYTGDRWQSGYFEEGRNYPELSLAYFDSTDMVQPEHQINNWGFEAFEINSVKKDFVKPSGYPLFVLFEDGSRKWLSKGQPLAIDNNYNYIISFWDDAVPLSFAGNVEVVAHAVPNPVLSSSLLFISGAEPDEKLVIFDLLGRKINDIYADEKGFCKWNLTGRTGTKVAAGTYFIYYFTTHRVEKCLILK